MKRIYILRHAKAVAKDEEDFDRVLADVKRAGVRHLGFVGNERFARAY